MLIINKMKERHSGFISKEITILKSLLLKTPLGSMMAIADEEKLYLLEFVNCPKLKREVEQISMRMKLDIISGYSEPLRSIENELSLYFAGKLTEFKTPLHLMGSAFQENVWERLKKITYGETRSYSDVAKAINYPTAVRAVARANGANQIAIIIPCHRVINHNGNLGGYAGGVERKQWLIDHEKKYLKKSL